jgi:hypothetical protein
MHAVPEPQMPQVWPPVPHAPLSCPATHWPSLQQPFGQVVASQTGGW